MGNLKLPNCLSTIVLLLITFTIFTHATPVNIPLTSVSDLLVQSAIDSLNDNSPTGHTYKSGNLISAQQLVEPPYIIYRLTLDLEPNCSDESSCPREACAIDSRQHKHGVIDVQINSIQCMYLYPQSDQPEAQQETIQEDLQDSTNVQEQDTINESFEKRVSNSSLQLTHEVQSVTDNIEKPFIAVRAMNNNYCPGCPYELNPTLPGLAAYKEQIVQSMDDSERSDFKHKVISIVRVTRAVPPGLNVIIYEILVEIGKTNCPRIGNTKRADCSLLPNVPIRLCLVRFEQRPGLQDSRKIIYNNCTDFPVTYDKMTNNVAEPLITNDTYTVSRLENDVTTRNENNERISKNTDNEKTLLTSYGSFIDESLDSAVETTPITGLSNQENAQKPVNEEIIKKIVIEKNNDDIKVQGFDDKYKQFDDFLENIKFNVPLKNRDPEPVDDRTPVNEEIIRPEIVSKKFNDNSNDVYVNDADNNTKRLKRWIIDARDDDEKELVRKLAQKVIEELDEIDVDDNQRVLLNVVDSKKVSGYDTIYYLTMRVAKTNCTEGTKDCLVDEREPTIICKAQIQMNDLRLPKTAKVLQSQCSDESKRHEIRSKRQLGSATYRNPDDPEIRDLAEKGLRKFSATQNIGSEPILVSILEATAQVVSGMKYEIKARFGESTCPRGVNENCILKEGSQPNDYLITVWSQPWVDKGNPDIKIESLKDKNTDRYRRSTKLVGATTTNHLEDPKVREYTEKALMKYTEIFGGDNEPYLIEILKSTRKTVKGTLYKIEVRLGESTCPIGIKENCQLKPDSPIKDYEITVWSQPWIDQGNPDIKIELASKNKRITKRSLRGVNYSPKMLNLGKTIGNNTVAVAFERFIQEHGKNYQPEEKIYRFEVFQRNMERIEKIRTMERGTATYGATIFADLTPEEFRSRHLGLRPDLKSINDIPLPMADIPDIELPTEFDWRQKNVITEVKDQGSCGSCWAFSVTGNIEALNAIKHGKLISLSEQELVDCDKLDSGCEGGLPDNAYRAIETIGGLELETDYPYDGEDEKCHFNKTMVKVKVTSGVNITSNETQMAQWLVQNGPISIGINANAMQFYMGGISHPFKFLCNADNLDHGVLIVGYGIHTYPIFKKKMPFWIIKNSWGPRWGEQGYYRVYRGDGTCGVNKMATSAVIA